MQYINSRWNKFVTGVITNISWIIVIAVSILTVLFSQLGTYHHEEGNISDLYSSYEEYGKIKRVNPVDVGLTDEDVITISEYYEEVIKKLEDDRAGYENVITQGYEIIGGVERELTSARKIYYQSMIESRQNSIKQNELELNLITSRALVGITESTIINRVNQHFTWIGEYRYDKIIRVATTDIYSWVLVIMLAFSASLIKVQGNKTGKNSGFKLGWKTLMRHATLSEKIAPKSVEAEAICVRMNKDELRNRRTARLQYVALAYEDVFTEDGTFKTNPNFAEVEVTSYTNEKGKLVFEENKYQKKLLKKQKKVVRKLEKYKVKEVHTYILLESKAEAKERFDYGESLRKRDRRTTLINVTTSLITALPMFTAVSVFVITKDSTNLLLGGLGIVLNIVSLLFSIFSSYDYIINTWLPGVTKKCDTLLSIAIELGVADDIDKNWDERIEKEAHDALNKRGK